MVHYFKALISERDEGGGGSKIRSTFPMWIIKILFFVDLQQLGLYRLKSLIASQILFHRDDQKVIEEVEVDANE